MKESAHCCALCISFDIETFLETINTTASIYQLLLAGIEGMALGADIHFHFFFSGTRLKSFTAYAANHTLAVLGMDVFLHCCFTSFAYAMADNRKWYFIISSNDLQPILTTFVHQILPVFCMFPGDPFRCISLMVFDIYPFLDVKCWVVKQASYPCSDCF